MRNPLIQAAAAVSLLCAVASLASGQEFGPGGPRGRFGPGGPGGAGGRPALPPAPGAGPALPETWVAPFQWRSIGPANMGGRITSIAVHPSDPATFWIGTASGGVLHTTNGGTTYDYQFQHEGTTSIGDVEVAPSDPSIVWVGTGEANPRNSVSWGDGVYKSVDGGATWQRMGLERSFQIGRIAIHPANADVVYVGALGRLWGPSEERGLYRTSDGGATWSKILELGDATGVIDVQLKPDDPQVLLVASYERQRDGFDSNDPAKKWGEGSGLWRSADGGESWERIRAGLPGGLLGRIGLDWFRGDPNVAFAVVESDRITQEPEDAAYLGVQGEDAEVGARLTEVTAEGPGAEAGLQKGDIVLRLGDEAVLGWDDLSRSIRHHLAGETVRLELARERKTVAVDVTFAQRPAEKEDAAPAEGEQAPHPPADDEEADLPNPGPFHIGLGGQRENVQDQQGPDGNEYGGVYRSDDAGVTWRRINSLNPRPMYYSQVRVDPSDARYVYVLGTSLYKSEDGGATFSDDGHDDEVHVDHHALWIDPRDGRHMILGNDGGIYVTRDRMKSWDHHNHVAIGQFYHVTVGPREDYRVYGGLQDNGSWGGPSHSATAAGPMNFDWFRVGGGDGFVCRVDAEDPDQIYSESQGGALGGMNLRTGERVFARPRPPRGERYRFNWNTPFLLSSHNSRILYSAGNKVFRSLDRGREPQAISPEISATERGSATALAESPRDANRLYVGSDDGGLWTTRDGGHTWVDLWAEPAAAETPAAEAPAAETPVEAAPVEAPAAEAAAAPEAIAPVAEAPVAAAAPPAGLPERLRELDADGDGKLQEAELPERMKRMLERADADHDGALDAEELAALPGPGGGFRGGAGGERRPARPAPAAQEPVVAPVEPAAAVAAAAAAGEDPLSGLWKAQARGEGIEEGEGAFTIDLKLAEDGSVTGLLDSEIGTSELRDGRWDAASGELSFVCDSEMGEFRGTATIAGGTMSGSLRFGGGMFELGFEAQREAKAEVAAPPAEAGAGEATAGPGDGPQRIASLLPGRRWVSSLVASRFAEARVYATFDGHRSDDDGLYVFGSEDGGDTWRSLRANLPATAGSVRVLVEDLVNENLLFLGTEFGAWASIDRGASWTRLNGNLPSVAVHDFALHPTRGELVAATHGRSLWILDIAALRQFEAGSVAEAARLYRPNDVIVWRRQPGRGTGPRDFVGENPPESAAICYSLAGRPRRVELRIEDLAGEVLRELTAPAEPGLHRVEWDLRREAQAGGGGGRRRFAPRAATGTYVAVLEVDDTTYRQRFEVKADPNFPDQTWLRYEEMGRESEAATAEERPAAPGGWIF